VRIQGSDQQLVWWAGDWIKIRNRKPPATQDAGSNKCAARGGTV